jgi:nucleoside-diphosphate-sugar epimerase
LSAVLVTGASGFIGLAITRALVARGCRVVALNRSAPPALAALERGGQVRIVRADLADKDAVVAAAAGVEAVFHVAGRPGLVGRYADFYDANVRGTEHVLHAMRTHRIEKLVHTSTPSVVHPGGDLEGGDESLPYADHFASAYPETKAIAERAVLAASGTELGGGKRLWTVAIRPHLVWGPDDPNFAPRILARARRGRLALVGGGVKRVDATHLDAAVHAHLCAFDRLGPGAACAGRPYFIAQGEPMPLRELVFRFLRAAGLPERARSIPLPIALALGTAVETAYRTFRPGVEPPLTRFVAEQLGTAHWYRLDAARRDLGYEAPLRTDEGFRRLAAHWQAHGAP